MPDLRVVPDPPPDPLVGKVLVLPGPDGELARVLTIEHEYDDGTTLEYVDRPGVTMMCDTFAVRRWPLAPSPSGVDET